MKAKCQHNTAACTVKKIGESKDTFGSPETPTEIYYRCEVHGLFIHNVEKNFQTMPADKLNRDIADLASVWR